MAIRSLNDAPFGDTSASQVRNIYNVVISRCERQMLFFVLFFFAFGFRFDTRAAAPARRESSNECSFAAQLRKLTQKRKSQTLISVRAARRGKSEFFFMRNRLEYASVNRLPGTAPHTRMRAHNVCCAHISTQFIWLGYFSHVEWSLLPVPHMSLLLVLLARSICAPNENPFLLPVI